MKRIMLIVMCSVMCFVLFSCKNEDGESDMKVKETKPEKTVSVTFVNDVEEADIWILPQTEENLKTTLWGTASVSGLKAGEKAGVEVSAQDDGKYIVRIIDADKAYYSANDMILGDSGTVRFQTGDTKYEAEIVSLDRSGSVLSSKKEAFQGVLGAN